jgi:sulfur carrier protein ThiS
LEIPLKQNGIAIAINNTIIPKQNWHLHYLNEQMIFSSSLQPKRLIRLLGAIRYKSAGKT